MCNAYGTIGYSRRSLIHDILGIPRGHLGEDELRVVRPTDNVDTIKFVAEGASGYFEAEQMRWGFIPNWSETMPSRPLTNARSETVATLPSFRNSFRSKRCILPASEFYEWTGTGKRKRRVTFQPSASLKLFAFAGLWDVWKREERSIQSCTLITVSANSVVLPTHNRMPVILQPVEIKLWLDPGTSQEALMKLLAPLSDDLIAEVPPPMQENTLF